MTTPRPKPIRGTFPIPSKASAITAHEPRKSMKKGTGQTCVSRYTEGRGPMARPSGSAETVNERRKYVRATLIGSALVSPKSGAKGFTAVLNNVNKIGAGPQFHR